MGSAESFGGDVAVKKAGRQSGDSCGSGVRKEIQAVNVGAPVLWGKIQEDELCRQAFQSHSFRNDNNIRRDRDLDYTKSPNMALDLGVKVVMGKSGKIPRSSSMCTKRSGTALMDISRSKSGLLDADGISPEVAAYSGSRNISDKTQIVKQRNGCNGRSGDKRNGKIHKNRCDSISLKNGLVSFNSASGGNNHFGIYGLKSDVVDITKFIDEIPLNELLHGNYQTPSFSKDKGKKALNSKSGFMQSVRKACSVLQARKALQTEKSTEIENSSDKKVSTSFVATGSTPNQIDDEKEDSWTADMSSSDKVFVLPCSQIQEPLGKVKDPTLIADSPLHQPKDILERLTIFPRRDLESLLLDAGKPTLSLKNGNDPRSVKSISLRAGLPPFPWSHSFSGHNKLGADTAKLSLSRTMCHGKWVKVTNPAALRTSSDSLMVDLESLVFDSSLVPENIKSEHPGSEIATAAFLPSSGVCPTSTVPEDEHSPAYAAAKALCEMAIQASKTTQLLREPSQTAMKACKLKAMEKSDITLNTQKSTETSNLIKVGDEGFPSKKLKISTEIGSIYVSHTDSRRVLKLSSSQPVRSLSTKLFREPKSEIDNYDINIVKKQYMKPPRAAERPGVSQQKLKKVIPVKWNRPEG